MALIKCPECGRENVSDTATSCPQCGFNVAKSLINDNSITDEPFTPTAPVAQSPKKRSIPIFLCIVFLICAIACGGIYVKCNSTKKNIQSKIEEIEKSIRRTEGVISIDEMDYGYARSSYKKDLEKYNEQLQEEKNDLSNNKTKSIISLIALICSIIAFVICILILI